MIYKSAFTNEKRYRLSIATLILQLFVGLAFTMHLFMYGFSSNAYLFIVVVFALMFAVVKPIIKSNISLKFALHWLLAFMVIMYSYVFLYRSGTAIYDLLVLLSGLIIVIAFSLDIKAYQGSIKYIKYLGLLFAIGVLFQRFIPTLYNLIIRLFPSGLQTAITSAVRTDGSGYRGFTTNAGFCVNYLLIGILAIISDNINREKWSIGSKTIIAMLMLATLFTGKRGPILFFVIALVFCYLIPARGKKKHTRFWRIFLGFSVLIILFFTFEDALADIPIFREVINTINGISGGEDVTSGRTKLYAWAIQLFLNNPIKGVGWGYFRRTVVGEITIRTTLDVHNIYLQLLCETGIIGFLIFTTIFISSWIATKNAYCNCVEETKELRLWKPALLFSFVFQTYFILYGLTGNPLYDQFYQIIYMFCCSITIAYRHLTCNLSII